VKIYTKTGDAGDTSLFGGGRVGKDAVRVAAYGDVDELNAAIGLAMATPPTDLEHDLLESIQRDLFAVGGQLASPGKAARDKTSVPDDRIVALERAIDRIDEEVPALRAFILPGGTPKAAHLHLARTVCRRAERAVVTLHHVEAVPPEILRYLNRLSDLLFMLARLDNHRAGLPDHTW